MSSGAAFVFSERLETFGQVRAVDDDARQVTVVVSTGDIARDGAIIDQRGWQLGPYERNPVVLWAHDDHALPIAKTLRTTTSESEMVQVHEFAEHARAQEVFALVRGGFVNATSVRWIPGETEVRKVGAGKDARNVLVFTQGHELLETSYVPIPADTGALVVRADGSPFDPEQFGRDTTINIDGQVLADAVSPEQMYCCAHDCRNPTDVAYALCDDCSELLDTARAQRAATPDPRAARLIALAESIRAKAHQGGAA